MNKESEKVFTERGFTNIEQMAIMFDWYKEEIERQKEIIRQLDIKNLELTTIIKEVRQDLLNTKRLNKHIKDKYNNEYLNMDIEHIDYLIKILDKDNNNEY